MKIKIEKGIEIPVRFPKRYNAIRSFPFEKMKVWDSFRVKNVNQAHLVMSAKRWAKRNNPSWVFITRSIGDFVRVWRIK